MKKYILFSILLFILFLTGILLSSPIQGPKISVTIDSLVVLKSKRQMYAYSKNKCIKIYDIALGRQAVGKKHFEGDLKTPEGLYS
jgi:murein L,D-transpeptidase YafK